MRGWQSIGTSKYRMKSNSAGELLSSLPIVQAMRHRRDFQATATIETCLSMLEIGSSYADSGQLSARWDRAIRVTDGRVLWCFETEEDAALFICRFGGVPRGAATMRDWQRENYA